MADANLPTDIIAEEILPKLPPTSLVRFKCVSKSFQTLISTPEFIHRHLNHSLSTDTKNRHLILIGKPNGLYTFHLDNSSPEFPATSLRFPDGITEGSGGGLFIVGSSNGLVCIGMPLSSLIIFNPFIGVYKEVDDSMNIFAANSCINYAFGFDDVNIDYKVVRVMTHYSYGYDDDYLGMRREVNVYSMKASCWSLVERGSYHDSMKHMENGAVVDGCLVHWRFWNAGNNEHRIGCFDLRSNRWGDDVALPDYNLEIGGGSSDVSFADLLFQSYRNKQNDLIHLGVLDGCLCLLTEKVLTVGVDVWVMKEYGLQESWVKLASILGADVGRPLKISPFTYGKGSKSEILVRVDSNSNFLWYNIVDRTWRWAEINGVPPYSEACVYKGSLVSIEGGARFQIGTLDEQGQERMQAGDARLQIGTLEDQGQERMQA